jgi:hypothetical protein
MEGRKTNLISNSKKLMTPLQRAIVEDHCNLLSSMLKQPVELDIFTVTLALVELSGDLIVKMEQQGMTKEVEALKEDG